MITTKTTSNNKQKLPSKLAWLGVFAFVAALLGLLAFSLISGRGDGNVKIPFSSPPAFTLQLFDGYNWENKSDIGPALAKGRPLVINFWASWCIPCREEAPTLEKISKEYASKGVIFLGVDYQDRQEDALAFLKKYGVSYPNGPDTSGEIAIAYGTTGVPETWFISADGKVRRKYISPLNEPSLRAFLEELLKSNG